MDNNIELTNSAYSELTEYISKLNSNFDLTLKSGGHLALCNSGIRGGVKEFNLGIPETIHILQDIVANHSAFASATHYEEKAWRDLGNQYFNNVTASSLITVQTKPVFTTLSKLIHWANCKDPQSYKDGIIDLSINALEATISKLHFIETECSPTPTEIEHLPMIDFQDFISDEQEPTCQIYRSLLTKPFCILTGASGTGKTKLAISLAEYLSNANSSNSEVVAVGADWTDNRSVLGFVNHLNADEEGRPYYQSTPILDLLLRADKEPDIPYFLILDEMNLSHVERYFADFLSAMEQKDGLLKLHSESGDLVRSGQTAADVPPSLKYPDNLFVIGTVNIDETTYMFSPKVLDRANVIEFTVSNDEIAAFLADPKSYPEIAPAGPRVAEGFLQLAKQAREMGCDKLPAEVASKSNAHLLDLFNILKVERFEFAYRTAKEITIYLQVCRYLAQDKAVWDSNGWRQDLDDQILQKLMPKLHGSAGRIGKLLATLAHYCHSGENKSGVSTQLSAAAEIETTATTCFPKSLAKLQSMIRTLQDEQFVSFIQ